MQRDVKKSDWKHFKALREIALDRICDRTLGELQEIASRQAESNHERYLAVFRLIQDRDEQIASAFNDLSRSRMIRHLTVMVSLDLVDELELEKFTLDVREQIKTWLDLSADHTD